jgi:DNA repair ATPase RecN
MAKTPSKIPASKPRNPVVKNMKNTGTKVHTDKKKKMKQGNVKHKKAYAEHLEKMLVKSLSENYRLSEISAPNDVKGIKQKIVELSQEKEQLESAVNKAREITKNIKYERASYDIIVQLREVAEQVKINPREFQYYENAVMQAQSALESAVFELDDVFVDLYKNISNQLEELESQLSDLNGQ